MRICRIFGLAEFWIDKIKTCVILRALPTYYVNEVIMSKKWVCSTDSSHEFSSPTEDLFCTHCPPYVGVLMEVDGNTEPLSSSSSNKEIKKGVGLYMFLIDSSGSMFWEDAFTNVPIKRAKLVSGQVASAIFEMENLNNRDDAYLFVMCFDHTLKPFINFMSVRQVFDKFGDVKNLEESLFSEMSNMNGAGGATDINLTLKTAYNHAQKFIDGEMDVIGKVKPMVNSVCNTSTGDDFSVPNVRCLIFTDGEQYTGGINEKIEGNPFSNFIYNGSVTNILMGAFHGEKDSSGYKQLKSIMGNCPIHNEPQFFHFSEAAQTMRMRYLFRMGSGPGGFCEKCLTQFMSDKPIS